MNGGEEIMMRIFSEMDKHYDRHNEGICSVCGCTMWFRWKLVCNACRDKAIQELIKVEPKAQEKNVVVPIAISGTVRQAYNEDGTIDDEQFQLLPNGSWDGTEMFISFDAIDSHTRELVESLLKAQEEEK